MRSEPKPKRCGGGATDIIAANYRAPRPLDLSAYLPSPLCLPVLHTRNGGRLVWREESERGIYFCVTADLGIPTLKREKDEVTLREDLEREKGDRCCGGINQLISLFASSEQEFAIKSEGCIA